MEQYPNIAKVFISTAGTKNPANGDIMPGTTTAGPEFKCRIEPPANGNGIVKGIDGEAINFSWILYSNLETADISIGAKILVKNTLGQTIAKDTVKHFSRGQLNCRVWL